MMRVITPELLAGGPRRLKAVVGGALSPYLLGDGVPVFGQEAGFAVLLFANDDDRKIPGLADGFAVPVQWRKGRRHSPRLPAGIVEQAERARALLDAPCDCFLELPTSPDLSDVDLSRLPLAGGSMLVPLFTALRMAQVGSTPRSLVFSTGDWDDRARGVGIVSGYRGKVLAIDRLVKASGLGPAAASLWVPPIDALAARKEAETLVPGLAVRPLAWPSGKKPAETLTLQLAPLLQALEVEPDERTPVELREAYLNRPDIVAGPDRFDRYERLLASDAARAATGKEGLQGRPLATVLNPTNTSLTVMLLLALEPSRVLFVYDPRTVKASIEHFERRFPRLPKQLEPVSGLDGVDKVELVARFLGDEGVVDCTNGRSDLKALLVGAGLLAGATAVVVGQDDRKPFSASPRIDTLRWAQSLRAARLGAPTM